MKRRSQYLERHEWLSSITKYCACQDKWQAKITKQSPNTAPHINNNPRPPNRVTKQCTNHEQWQAKTTKHSPCHQNWQANPAARTFTELVLDWTNTWLSQDWAKLCLDWKWLLDWTNASLKCYCAELWLHWTLRVWKTWYIGILSTKLPLHIRYWHSSCETHCLDMKAAHHERPQEWLQLVIWWPNRGQEISKACWDRLSQRGYFATVKCGSARSRWSLIWAATSKRRHECTCF